MSRARAAALFALLGGGLAWTVQLWLGYLLGDVPCRADGTAAVAGIGVDVLWYLMSAASAAVALAAIGVGSLAWRSRPGADDAAGALRWVGLIGAGASAIFLGAILLGAFAPLLVPCTT